MKKQKMYRHGEIGLRLIDKLPEGLVKSDSNIIIKGSHGNSHLINKGELYFKKMDTFVFGFLVAKNTSLLHKEHGVIMKGNNLRQAKLPDGVYELRIQQEFINNELKQVID